MGDVREWEPEFADIYGVTSYIPTMEITRGIVKKCRGVNVEAVVVGGGANVTDLYRSGYMGEFLAVFDSIVVGPGEEAILDLVADYPSVKGVYEHRLRNDLDWYAPPAYHLVDLSSYTRRIGGERSITTLTGRGCPFGCAFCTISDSVCQLSAGEVVFRIRGIVETYGIRSFNFQDDTFLLNRDRVGDILKGLRGLDIKFRCHGRVGLDTRGDYDLLREAGCVQICWGIESGNQGQLRRMLKRVTVQQNREVIGWAKKAGILDRVFLVLGFPGETRETLEDTKRFIEEENPSQVFASSFQPYPGTAVWKNPEDFGVTRLYTDFSRYVQIQGDGTRGLSNVDTQWMRREEMEEAEGEFREWLVARPETGALQDYEVVLDRGKRNG
jgi:radical SAM superfamily enzyme YgiQ (UPF0313 family)